MTIIIELDDTAEMMLSLLRAEMAREPYLPATADAGYSEVAEASRKHDQWDQQVWATRLMLSSTLLRLTLEQTKAIGG